MKTLLSAFAVFVAVSQAAAQETGAAAYDDFTEPWRGKFIQTWQAALESAKEEAKLAEKGKIGVDTQLKNARDRLAKLEKNDPPYFGTLEVGWLKVGAFGRPRYMRAKVIQVIDESQMLVGLSDYTRAGDDPTLVWLKSPTAGIVDGKLWTDLAAQVTGNNPLVVSGTKIYKTVDGGTRTVFTVEVLDVDSIKVKLSPEEAKKRAEEKARAEEEARKRAEEAKARAEEEEAKAKALVAEEAKRKKAEADEKAAASKLRQAKVFLEERKPDFAREYLEQVIKDYPNTKAVPEAKELLEKLNKK